MSASFVACSVCPDPGYCAAETRCLHPDATEPAGAQSAENAGMRAGAETRLTVWARDEEHAVQSVRHWEPQYANPGELRADVRALVASLTAARRERDQKAAQVHDVQQSLPSMRRDPEATVRRIAHIVDFYLAENVPVFDSTRAERDLVRESERANTAFRERDAAIALVAAARQREQQLTQAAKEADNALAMTQLPCDCGIGEECYCLSYPTDVQVAKARALLAGEAPPTAPPESVRQEQPDAADAGLTAAVDTITEALVRVGDFVKGVPDDWADGRMEYELGDLEEMSQNALVALARLATSEQVTKDSGGSDEGKAPAEAGQNRQGRSESRQSATSAAPGVPGSPTAPRPEAPEEQTGAPAELRSLLAEVYTPEGVEVWLAHAAKQGWTLEEQLQRAEALATGEYS